MSEWQPIDAAPKDGTAILVSDASGQFVVKWQPLWNCWQIACFCNDSMPWAPEPTHWMPLPEPPQCATE